MNICEKIDCSSCHELGNCTKTRQQVLFENLFKQYGSYRKEYTTKTLYLHAEHPEKMHTQDEVTKAFLKADAAIEELETYIAMYKAYKIELAKRYNYLETRPTKEKIKLQRYKKYQGNVFYYIIFYLVDLETGEEIETDRQTYKGTERKQAFTDFDKICKEHKNAVIEKDIDRKSWEK